MHETATGSPAAVSREPLVVGQPVNGTAPEGNSRGILSPPRRVLRAAVSCEQPE